MQIRYRYIDRLKGIAILLVVLGHILVFSTHSAQFTTISKYIGSMHMQLFMFVSGFVGFRMIEKPYKNGIAKVLRRIPKYVWPMYVVGWLLAIFLMLMFMNKDNVAVNMTLASAYWGNWYWYLKTLSIFTVMSLPVMIYKNKVVDVGVVLFNYVLFFILWKFGKELGVNLCMEHATCFFPFYVMGMFCRKYKEIYKIISFVYVPCISLIIYVILFNIEFSNHLFYNVSVRFMQPICAIVFLRYVFAKTELIRNCALNELENLGKQSLDIYLFHYFLVFPINFYILDSLGKEVTPPSLMLLLFISVTICIAYLSMLVGTLIRKSNILSILIFSPK